MRVGSSLISAVLLAGVWATAASPAMAQSIFNWGSKPAQAATPATPAAAAPPAPAVKPTPKPCLTNPNGLGVERVVEVDTSSGPAFGMEQYKAYDFLEDHEVVLTFDDGPWPGSTKAVLDALDEQCTKAIFFSIGKHALWHPEILKEVAKRGHTVGSHTWSHANLSKLKPEKAREEIELGLSAVKLALGAAPAPFFRFPALQDPKEQIAYLGQRGIAIFSMDLDSFDFKIRKPELVVKSIIDKLEKKGKGIILMHDFQAVETVALPETLRQLKARGYKVVQMKAKSPATTLPEFDEMAQKEFKGPVATAPVASVVRTISE